jgi:hypothetical protein
MIEEDAGGREEVVTLAIVHGDVVREGFGHAVRAARIERRGLALRHLAHLAEHLRGRRLINPDRRVDDAHRFEDARDALRVELARQHRLVPRRRHERHRREVVQLVRLDALEDADERQLIEQVPRNQRNPIADVLDAPVVVGRESARETVDPVAALEEQFRQVRSVLAGNAGNQGAFRHRQGR